MIKLIVSDLDGTLLRSDFSLSMRNIEAIKKIKQRGICFIPASGRDYANIQCIFEPYGIKCPAIEINGAQARDDAGNILFSLPISSPQSRACIKIIKEFDLTIQLFTDKGSFAYENSISLQQDMEAVISRNMGQPADVERLPAITASELNELIILKMEIMSLDETKLYQCQSALKANSDLLLTSSVRGNLEITHKDANKGAALDFILDCLKLRKEEVIIFGDSMNDASLFECFPNTVAVKNAHPYILGLAKAVCEACEEDGVGKWLAANLCL